ncbi:alanyl-tRNA editing protein [Xenorhabdus sp. Vera]|uniref:alanyl-tRNA editing protein n=1 Tax=Xenorhabdus koppenhoeferi TaxID=351659 RepID=UPI0019A27FDF|nr:alanyl-tRNA editing protein [Xenorhabdus sp. Vera]MBD2811370.1 alanyl-tRNA editing protein [Xenorhabdus sp. Vera]
MTERLYLSSNILSGNAEIIDCIPRDDGRYSVRLNSTIFHPQGGGQPSDIGWINEVTVVHVTIEENEIIHITTAPVTLGNAFVRVDSKRRQLNSRLHSAGHLIGHIVELDMWHPIKAHHWPGESKVVFKAGVDSQSISAEDIQTKCKNCITQDLPCKMTQRDDGLREIGFGHFKPYLCGGTHVISLKQLGDIKIQEVKMKKGNLAVYYDVV